MHLNFIAHCLNLKPFINLTVVKLSTSTSSGLRFAYDRFPVLLVAHDYKDLCSTAAYGGAQIWYQQLVLSLRKYPYSSWPDHFAFWHVRKLSQQQKPNHLPRRRLLGAQWCHFHWWDVGRCHEYFSILGGGHNPLAKGSTRWYKGPHQKSPRSSF